MLLDGAACRDANECLDGSHECQELCRNEEGSYRCLCPAGYKLASDGYACADIDEVRPYTLITADLASLFSINF